MQLSHNRAQRFLALLVMALVLPASLAFAAKKSSKVDLNTATEHRRSDGEEDHRRPSLLLGR